MGRWGVRPKDFWAMSPWEFWTLAEAHKPQPAYAGGLSESDVAELHEEMVSWGAFANG